MKNNGNNKNKVPVLLVVDDVKDNLDLLEFSLKRKPVIMLRASSGRECLEIAKEKNPDIIVLDIQMPEMDGFETLKQLRKNPLTSTVPVILLTAQYKEPESIERGFTFGADEYLTKPIDIEELLVRIRMLIRMKRIKDELDKTKSDFVSMLIHDLRSPLIGIKSVVQLLKELESGTELTEDHYKMFESAEISLNMMLTLINNFLDLSKYNSDTIQMYREPIPLQAIIETSLKQIKPRYIQKQVSLQDDIETNLPPAYIDAQKTQQVLLNLLDNALKFTASGGSVKIGAELLNGSNGQRKNKPVIRVSVTDNGVGINALELKEAFNPYKQTESSKTISEKGTGLGLSICKMIVEAQGGSISAECDPGKNTTFYFTLPVAKQN